MLTVLPSTNCYHVNKPHVDLVYLKVTGFIKMFREESSFAPSCLANDLQSSAKLEMSILPSYCHSYSLLLALTI